jgi:hypothetical protein
MKGGGGKGDVRVHDWGSLPHTTPRTRARYTKRDRRCILHFFLPGNSPTFPHIHRVTSLSTEREHRMTKEKKKGKLHG